MFVKKLEEKFGLNNPIFAEEILDLYKNYTRAYVFRLIKKAEEKGELVSYSRGVYYIPKKTFFGKSTINSEMVAEKKYIKDSKGVFGIYAGLNLLNKFGITTQVPNTMEIVTNNETTRKRKVNIGNKEFIIRKSRCEINENNYPEYTVVQLFSDLDKNDVLDDFSKKQIQEYIKENKISKDRLFNMSLNFPSITLKNMVKSGVLNGAL